MTRLNITMCRDQNAVGGKSQIAIWQHDTTCAAPLQLRELFSYQQHWLRSAQTVETTRKGKTASSGKKPMLSETDRKKRRFIPCHFRLQTMQ
jgi:hypothetical protein